MSNVNSKVNFHLAFNTERIIFATYYLIYSVDIALGVILEMRINLNWRPIFRCISMSVWTAKVYAICNICITPWHSVNCSFSNKQGQTSGKNPGGGCIQLNPSINNLFTILGVEKNPGENEVHSRGMNIPGIQAQVNMGMQARVIILLFIDSLD